MTADHDGKARIPTVPTELDDRWILNLRGLSVTQIAVDFRLVLTLDSDWLVTIEAPADLLQGPGRTESNPGFHLTPETQDVAPALGLFGSRILSAVAFKSGTLRLVFDNGMHLTSRSDPEFEAWQVTGPDGQSIVSMPGGELALWLRGVP